MKKTVRKRTPAGHDTPGSDVAPKMRVTGSSAFYEPDISLPRQVIEASLNGVNGWVEVERIEGASSGVNITLASPDFTDTADNVLHGHDGVMFSVTDLAIAEALGDALVFVARAARKAGMDPKGSTANRTTNRGGSHG